MRIRNYSNALSYEVITMALGQTLTMGIYICVFLLLSMAHVSDGGSGVGVHWVPGRSKRVYPFSMEYLFLCATVSLTDC